jgi:hypothetical protein
MICGFVLKDVFVIAWVRKLVLLAPQRLPKSDFGLRRADLIGYWWNIKSHHPAIGSL